MSFYRIFYYILHTDPKLLVHCAWFITGMLASCLGDALPNRLLLNLELKDQIVWAQNQKPWNLTSETYNCRFPDNRSCLDCSKGGSSLSKLPAETQTCSVVNFLEGASKCPENPEWPSVPVSPIRPFLFNCYWNILGFYKSHNSIFTDFPPNFGSAGTR